MKYSKIVLGLLVSVTVFSLGCDNKQPTTANDPTKDVTSSKSPTPTSSASLANYQGGLEIISTPKAPNPSGIEESPPTELSPLPTGSPFIIGKAPPEFGGGAAGTDASPTPTLSDGETPSPTPSPQEVVVPSKISGTVYGYNPTTKKYVTVPRAEIAIGDTYLKADDGGRYYLNEEISTFVSISAFAEGYVGSTVKSVTPGENRDIHLQPLDNRKQYNPNTIILKNVNLLGVADANNVQHPKILSFGDVNDSRFIPYLTNALTGTYRVEINPTIGNTVAKGKLLVYDQSRDFNGNPTNPTQMRTFQFLDPATFRVGDTTFPDLGEEPEIDQDKDFTNISADFRTTENFSSFVCNAYIVFSTGEKVLASKFVSTYPQKVSFRLPKYNKNKDISYSIEAHAGDALRGSDVVVNNLRENDSFTAYLLPTPQNIAPNHYTTSVGTSPSFSWSTISESKAYQVEVEKTDNNDFRWEGFSTDNSIPYPTSLTYLQKTKQYRCQVIAMDFYKSGLYVLNTAEDMRLRAERIKNSKDLQFKVLLAKHDTNTLPRGYRASYNTTLFRTK